MENRLNALLRLAIKHKATDIHFSKYQDEFKLEMRINDAIYPVKSESIDERLVKYLQYLANLDIGNIKIPQTGQFEWYLDDELLSLRFALIQSQYMENAVLRILNDSLGLNINNLSIDNKQNEFFKSMINHKIGIYLCSGPTGSGKTTSLYTMLSSIKNRKIFTIEDPVEIHSNKFVQININEAIGLNYDEAIKQVLRHDPDIIMIGEIRDEITAKMAIRAANTGHMVIATVHSGSAISTIDRMLELGVSKTQLRNNLIGISNQRLFKSAKDNNKVVIYETMDINDLNYYFDNNHLHKDFLDLKRRIDEAIKEGIIEDNKE